MAGKDFPFASGHVIYHQPIFPSSTPNERLPFVSVGEIGPRKVANRVKFWNRE